MRLEILAPEGADPNSFLTMKHLRILVDGHDISGSVREVRLTASIGEIVEASLVLAPSSVVVATPVLALLNARINAQNLEGEG